MCKIKKKNKWKYKEIICQLTVRILAGKATDKWKNFISNVKNKNA